MDRSRDKYISNLEKSVSEEKERFKVGFREEMHERIEQGIGNKECEEVFKNEQEQRTKELRENIKRRSNECKERFIEEIKKILNNLKRELKIL